MLSGRGLCDGLITRPEESYRLWCVAVCDLEKPQERGGHSPRLGCKRHRKKIYIYIAVLQRYRKWYVQLPLGFEAAGYREGKRGGRSIREVQFVGQYPLLFLVKVGWEARQNFEKGRRKNAVVTLNAHYGAFSFGQPRWKSD